MKHVRKTTKTQTKKTQTPSLQNQWNVNKSILEKLEVVKIGKDLEKPDPNKEFFSPI